MCHKGCDEDQDESEWLVAFCPKAPRQSRGLTCVPPSLDATMPRCHPPTPTQPGETLVAETYPFRFPTATARQ